MLKFILIGLPAILLLLTLIVALRPGDFRITRSAAFAVPPSIAFERVNDLHRWNDWSPWAKLDPNARYMYTGRETGPGASLAWVGYNQVGEGRMTIVDSVPSERVRMKLEFMKPFAATNTAEFTFTPEGDQTRITWSMFGKSTFMCKAMSLVMNCERMVGGHFDQESPPPPAVRDSRAQPPATH